MYHREVGYVVDRNSASGMRNLVYKYCRDKVGTYRCFHVDRKRGTEETQFVRTVPG
jgi:hypothetical protein